MPVLGEQKGGGRDKEKGLVLCWVCQSKVLQHGLCGSQHPAPGKEETGNRKEEAGAGSGGKEENRTYIGPACKRAEDHEGVLAHLCSGCHHASGLRVGGLRIPPSECLPPRFTASFLPQLIHPPVSLAAITTLLLIPGTAICTQEKTEEIF